jgi:hypothetical protein
MPRGSSDPEPEKQNVVFIDVAIIDEARRLAIGCESCSEDAHTPFDKILDYVTGSDPSVTNYVLEVTVRCVSCGAAIDVDTLVELSL